MTKYLAYVVTALALVNAAVLLIEHWSAMPSLTRWMVVLCGAGLLWMAARTYRAVEVYSGTGPTVAGLRRFSRPLYAALVTAGLIVGLLCVGLSQMAKG